MLDERNGLIDGGLRRYEAMADMLDGVPEGVIRRAIEDRVAYGARYLYTDPKDGQFRWSVTHVLRFMVEVCGVSYAEARAGVIAELQEFQRGSTLPDPVQQGRMMFDACGGNIIEALEQARIEMDAQFSAPDIYRHTREVVFYLETLTFTSAYDGAEDWK